MLEQYPHSVKIVFKHFPLRNHKFGMSSSVAAWAAGQQDKFWEMHDLIFANYSQLSDAKFTEFAEQIGLDMARFASDLTNPQATKEIQASIQNGVKARVKGTPSIFVNGRRLTDRSFAGFKKAIDAELK